MVDPAIRTSGGTSARSIRVVAGAACLAAAAVLLAGAQVAAQAPVRLKVMDWNIHHGVDTSGANNLERVVDWIVRIDADVVSLNEVEKRNGYNGNADEPVLLETGLESRTGRAWYGCFAQRVGAAVGQGNLILSRIPLQSCDPHLLSDSRSVARATLRVGDATLSVYSTHLDDGSATIRARQVSQLTAWAAQSGAGTQRILMGDFNASSTATELQALRTSWEDAWAAAAAAGVAVSYPGNTAGNTRNGRIDYIWRAKDAIRLTLQGAQVFDTGTTSDHRPLSATYAVDATATGPQTPANLRVVSR